MKRITLFLSFFPWICATAFAQVDTTQRIQPGRANSLAQQDKPYVILISADGFRYDYAEKYGASNLLSFADKGVQAAAMVPAFPSKTFPNHYSIVTGLYPAHHGLVNNNFYDPQRKQSYSYRDRSKVEDGSWYGGTPLWVLAEKQQMLSASFYWVGSEAPVQGILPTYHYQYNEQVPMQRRIQTVVDWLNLPAAERPHLITFYMPDVDHAGHAYGPDAPETEKAVKELDANMKALTEAVAATGLPVNYVFVSDHGMLNIDVENVLRLPAAVDTAKFKVSGGGTIVELHAKDKRAIRKTYKLLKKESKLAEYQVYHKKNMPRHLHYGAKDDTFNRIGDILLLADAPKVFHFSSRKPSPGTHGYDATITKEMHTVFYAWGPAFENCLKIPAFDNVEVYDVITSILGLPYTHPIDGTKKLSRQILRKK